MVQSGTVYPRRRGCTAGEVDLLVVTPGVVLACTIRGDVVDDLVLVMGSSLGFAGVTEYALRRIARRWPRILARDPESGRPRDEAEIRSGAPRD